MWKQKITNANLIVHDTVTFNTASTQCCILSIATEGAIASVSIFMVTIFMIRFLFQVMVKQQFKENLADLLNV